jgi:hypothetical protein
MLEPLLTSYGFDSYFPKQFEKLSLSRADVLIRLSPRLRLYNASKIIEENDLPEHIFENINIQEDIERIKLVNLELDEIKISEPITISRNKPEEFDIPKSEKGCIEFIHKHISSNNFYSAFLWSDFFQSSSLISNEIFRDLGKKTLREEYEYWNDNNIPFMALHALQDLVVIFPDEINETRKKTIAQLRAQLNIVPRKT